MATSDIPGDIEQTRRRQAGAIPVGIASGISAAPTQQAAPKPGAMKPAGQPAPSSLPAGIGLTPGQIEAQSRAEGRRRAAETIQRTNAAVGRTFDAAGNAIGTAKNSILSIGTGVVDAVRNANVQHLPDYSTPAKDAIKPGPTPQQQAGGIMAFDMAERATDAGIAYDRQMRAMPRPATPIPDTLKAPSGGTVASGGAGGQASRQPVTQSNEQPAERDQFSQVGYGGIVGRMGANGVPEFSNRPQDVQGSGPQRAVGRAGDGDGGGLSVGDPGDSQRAIDRFERANAERAKTIDMLKRHEPSGVVGIRGPMTMDDVLQSRLGMRQREADLADRELRQRGIEAGMDMNLRERELTATEQRNQLESQRTQQEIEAGDMTLAQQRRVEELSARIADPATDATERETLLRTYSQLTGKKLDSGTIKLKRASADPLTGAKTEEEYLADARTGRPLVEQGGATAISANQQAIAIRDNPQLSREQKVAQLKALGYN